MSKKLIIVESPSKAGTIQKYLKDQGYIVIASKGHIRDLPVDELGIDIDNNFEIKDVTIKGKEAVIKDIKEKAKDIDIIYLASDPDREGEKISQSIYEVLPKKGKTIKRVKFNAVTKDAIEKAIKNAGDIDELKCSAQKVRRILDRLVGYKISPILWNKIKSGISAGRVQSVALRIIVEREDAIKSFIPETWATIIVKFEKDSIKFESEYFSKNNLLKKEELSKREQAEEIAKQIKDKLFKVVKVDTEEKEQKPTPPFTTSKLQQEASVKLGFETSQTMQVAQKLYEGVYVKSKGQSIGLITYMRTDSVRVEPQAIVEVRDLIKKEYGDSYLPNAAIEHKDKKAGNVQDAHEAIRPTYLSLKPEEVRGDLSVDEFKLYNLIYQKFVSSQMANAILEKTVIFFDCEGYIFRSTGSVVKFDGFKKAFSDLKEEKKSKKGESEESELALPRVLLEDLLKPLEAPKVVDKTTSPPARFNEATLVKELEERGVGRPSTYASIIKNITSKLYVEKEKNRFKPTSLGEEVCRALVAHFPKEMDVDFTASVEDSLDLIEEGKLSWLEFVEKFWKDFNQALDKALLEMKKTRVDNRVFESTKIKCLSCSDGEYLVKSGKNGEFLACSNYPTCKSTQNFKRNEDKTFTLIEKQQKAPTQLSEKVCPKCGSKMAIRKTKDGSREFYSCSNYPKCTCALPIDTTGKKCPKCSKGEIVPKKSKNGRDFWGCSDFPKCDQVYWEQKDVDAIVEKKAKVKKEKKTK